MKKQALTSPLHSHARSFPPPQLFIRGNQGQNRRTGQSGLKCHPVSENNRSGGENHHPAGEAAIQPAKISSCLRTIHPAR